jgi:hypothetical protein
LIIWPGDGLDKISRNVEFLHNTYAVSQPKITVTSLYFSTKTSINIHGDPTTLKFLTRLYCNCVILFYNFIDIGIIFMSLDTNKSNVVVHRLLKQMFTSEREITENNQIFTYWRLYNANASLNF